MVSITSNGKFFWFIYWNLSINDQLANSIPVNDHMPHPVWSRDQPRPLLRQHPAIAENVDNVAGSWLRFLSHQMVSYLFHQNLSNPFAEGANQRTRNPQHRSCDISLTGRITIKVSITSNVSQGSMSTWIPRNGRIIESEAIEYEARKCWGIAYQGVSICSVKKIRKVSDGQPCVSISGFPQFFLGVRQLRTW